MTTRQEIAEGKRLSKEYHDRVNAEAYNRKRDMATMYSDETIRALIDLAANKNVPPEISMAKSQVAQAMIAYKNMINERWNK